jgi:EmrB/QacA subfamily drug resistance transporter
MVESGGRFGAIPYKWLVAICFVSGLFMDILDTTIVNVALPTIGRDFRAGNTTLEWVVTAYLLSLAVWIPASAWFGDRIGTKRVFMFALAMFTLGSALCATANSMEMLIIFRVIQGVGGGMMTPVGTSMLFRAFPPAERAAATAVLIIPTALAPMMGPLLGGWLVDNASWHWIFIINIPVGILAFVFSGLVLKEERQSNAGRFDIPGFVLSGSGLPLILYALSQAPEAGWTAAKVLLPGILGIALFVALIAVELRTSDPLLHLHLFANRMFRNGIMAVFATFAGILGVIFLLPLFLQQLRGITAFQSGLATFPQALGLVVMGQVSSRIYPLIGPRRMVAVGLAAAASTTAVFYFVDLRTSLWVIRGIMFVFGLSLGLAMVPVQTATYATIDPPAIGRATSLFSTTRQVAGSVSVAIIATILASRTKAHISDARAGMTDQAQAQAAARHGALLGFHDAFIGASILILIGVVCAFLIHDEDAAATMVRKGATARQASGEPVNLAPTAH